MTSSYNFQLNDSHLKYEGLTRRLIMRRKGGIESSAASGANSARPSETFSVGF